MSQVYIFRNRIPSCNYVFKDGSTANFINGIYTTDDPYKAQEMQDMVDGWTNKIDNKGNEIFTADGKNVRVKIAPHPHIYQEDGVKVIDSEQLDPLWQLKATLRKQILEELATDPSRDMGNYVQGKLNVANSSDIGVATQGASTFKPGATQALAAQLANLMAPPIRTGDPEPNPNAVPNAEAAPGNAPVIDTNAQVAGVNAADALAALMAANAVTKNSIQE